jgi:hypothetical protein
MKEEQAGYQPIDRVLKLEKTQLTDEQVTGLEISMNA